MYPSPPLLSPPLPSPPLPSPPLPSPQGAMTNNQLKQSEETVLEVIKAAQPVFAKETPLSLAKEVQGLRAVFDEVR